jgi:RimJ/RimL family protein N-acetyltransferase
VSGRREEIVTARLCLRWLTEADAAFMLDIWNDPAFVRFVGDRGVRTIDDAVETLRAGALATYRQYGYGPFLVTLAGTGEAVGLCGLFRRPYLPDPDLGYALLPAFRRKGYAIEAAEATLAHARDDLGLARLLAIVDPENDRSVGLLRRLGFHYEKELRLPGEDGAASLYGLTFGG